MWKRAPTRASSSARSVCACSGPHQCVIFSASVQARYLLGRRAEPALDSEAGFGAHASSPHEVGKAIGLIGPEALAAAKPIHSPPRREGHVHDKQGFALLVQSGSNCRRQWQRRGRSMEQLKRVKRGASQPKLRHCSAVLAEVGLVLDQQQHHGARHQQRAENERADQRARGQRAVGAGPPVAGDAHGVEQHHGGEQTG
jgi:hypothetical protein